MHKEGCCRVYEWNEWKNADSGVTLESGSRAARGIRFGRSPVQRSGARGGGMQLSNSKEQIAWK